MTGAAPDLLMRIAALPADRAAQVDAAICGLVLQGSKLGELESREIIGFDGVKRAIKVPPRAWFARLERALQVGAFDRLRVDDIVDRILLPQASEGETSKG